MTPKNSLAIEPPDGNTFSRNFVPLAAWNIGVLQARGRASRGEPRLLPISIETSGGTRVYAISRWRVGARIREPRWTCTCTPWKHLKRKVSASWSLATTLELLRADLKQGREVLAQAEPYQKWYSYAFTSGEPWKGEHGFDLRKNESCSRLKAVTWLTDYPPDLREAILFNYAGGHFAGDVGNTIFRERIIHVFLMRLVLDVKFSATVYRVSGTFLNVENL